MQRKSRHGDELTRMSFWIPVSLLEEVKTKAKEAGSSDTRVIVNALKKYLKK